MNSGPVEDLREIGARLRSYRLGRGLSPEMLARRLSISRAALYRAEKGEISKIDMLSAIARELNVSLPSLMGVGIEYLDNAISFFDRMRHIEESCDQIIGMFSPVSYLLTSSEYDAKLSRVLYRSCPADDAGSIGTLLDILLSRKQNFSQRRPLIASIISSVDIERFLRHGLEGADRHAAGLVQARRDHALREVRHIKSLLEDPEIGVQIGIAREPLPATSFQIMRLRTGSVVTISPFRLGQNPNIRIGVGLVTSAPEAIELHEEIAEQLWRTSMKGPEAARHLEGLIRRNSAPSHPSQI